MPSIALIQLAFLCFVAFPSNPHVHASSSSSSPSPSPSPPALFVFGDSYADTGNHDKHNPSLNTPWRPPYGMTWPGRPAGRFSDGRVLTDFFASFLNISSPLPFQQRGSHPSLVSRGINFAFGGSGVFPTYAPHYLTFDGQIDEMRALVRSGLYPTDLLAKAVVLLVYAGNDYIVYFDQHSHPQQEELLLFVQRVVQKLGGCLEQLRRLGFTRFAVTNLEPGGCLPLYTHPTYTSCNSSYRALTASHNQLLRAEIVELQKQRPTPRVLLLNHHKAFLTAMRTFGPSHHKYTGKILQPCCVGMGNYSCGDTDSTGTPLYTVCSSPERAFFWDDAHPTQAGWTAITQLFKAHIVAHFTPS